MIAAFNSFNGKPQATVRAFVVEFNSFNGKPKATVRAFVVEFAVAFGLPLNDFSLDSFQASTSSMGSLDRRDE